MKYFPVLIYLFFSINLFAQQNINTNKTYILTQNITLIICDPVGNPTGESINAFRGFEFRIVRILENELVIHFLKWSNNDQNNQQFFNTSFAQKTKTEKNSAIPDLYFILPVNEFNRSIERYSKAPFAVGIAVIPIKMRFGNGNQENFVETRYFNFESAVSLGFSVGSNIKLDQSKFTARNNLAILGGISLSSVPLDSFSTKGYLTTSSNNAAITGHIGLLYQIDNFQMGIFSGIDYLGGEVGRKWKYRNKPWMGIGLGYSIFQTKRTTDTQ